jgi:hypothetical protein
MKKLLTLAALVVCSIGARAQATSLTIFNRTSCEICFDLSGNNGSSGCTPLTSNTTTICIPPGATVTYTDASMAPFMPPLPPTGFMVGLCWTNHNPVTCPSVPLHVRCIIDPCAGPMQSDFLLMYDGSCEECGVVTGTWSTVGSAATVTFL